MWGGRLLKGPALCPWESGALASPTGRLPASLLGLSKRGNRGATSTVGLKDRLGLQKGGKGGQEGDREALQCPDGSKMSQGCQAKRHPPPATRWETHTDAPSSTESEAFRPQGEVGGQRTCPLHGSPRNKVRHRAMKRRAWALPIPAIETKILFQRFFPLDDSFTFCWLLWFLQLQVTAND